MTQKYDSSPVGKQYFEQDLKLSVFWQWPPFWQGSPSHASQSSQISDSFGQYLLISDLLWTRWYFKFITDQHPIRWIRDRREGLSGTYPPISAGHDPNGWSQRVRLLKKSSRSWDPIDVFQRVNLEGSIWLRQSLWSVLESSQPSTRGRNHIEA